jgi:penicillin-binding protein 1C
VITKRRLIAALAAGTVMLAGWIRMGPIPAHLLDPRAHASTLVVDRNGVPLYEALSDSGTRGISVDPAALPPTVVAATLAAEDRRFFAHPGVDPVAIVRALKTNLAERRIVEGGSTISQQVAKLLLSRKDPDRHRGVPAKVYEATLALRLEHRYTKDEMLAMYLNLASYGNQVAGIERASETYFGVRASMLTPAQAALLAGLPQRPSGYNPYRNSSGTFARQRTVLRRMAAAGVLSPAALQQALDERLSFVEHSTPFAAPHFVEMLLASMGGDKPARIETTIDSVLQADIAGIIQSHRQLLARHGAANVAVVVLDNMRGEWLAWEGSGDYFDKEHGGTINGPIMPRQPGSALKPFTYAVAFEQGFTPATVLADVPSHFPTAEPGVVYSPRNYDGKYRGALLARRALAGSENVPAVAVASEVGVPNLLRFLARAGLTSFEKNAAHYGLGVTLGNAEVRLDELVGAYAAFARGGEWFAPTYLRSDAKRSRRVLVSPRTAFWITDILSDAEAREFAFGRGGSLEFAFPVAVKTGTSQAFHDNWTIGYSREVTVGVWVGNFDRRPLRNSSGVTGAAPIFHAVMLAAMNRASAERGLDRHPIAEPPHTVQSTKICALSGMAANAWCPTKQHEWVAAESQPLPCSWHHLSEDGLLTYVPPQYRIATDTQDRLPLPALRVTRAVVSGRAPTQPPFRIANPPEGATYLIDPTLRRDFQTLPLRVVTSSGGPIEWSVNGDRVGSAQANESLTWPLAKGQHRFVARDQKGHTAEATITVR